MVVSFVVAFTGNFVPTQWAGVPAVALVVFVPAALPYYRFSRRLGLEIRKHDALQAKIVDASAQPKLNDQPHLLYLRSFNDIAARLKGDRTEEEHLALLLGYIGPVVAIGRPGEPLPNGGARRIYVDDSKWKSTVEDLMKSARLVAIRTGLSEGLRWELDKVFELLSPEQLLVVVDSKAELRSLLAGAKMPRWTVPHLGWRSIGSIRAFVISARTGSHLFYVRKDLGFSTWSKATTRMSGHV